MSCGVPASVTPATVFDFLVGAWELSRTISAQAEICGRMSVEAMSAEEAEYRERVEVRTTDGAVFEASMRYTLRRTCKGVDFYFAGGETLFQTLCFEADESGCLRAEAEHACGGDRYVSVYELSPDRRFRVRHAVRGPRKRYVSATEFRKVG